MTSSAGETGKRPQQGKQARDLNQLIRYTMWSVFALESRRVATAGAGSSLTVDGPAAPEVADAEGTEAETAELEALLDRLAADDITVRGVYDVSGLRADADVMVWWHAADVERLQSAYNAFRRTAFGRRLRPVWSQTALHRPAEFNKSHIPAFLADEEPADYVCVYPFVRSYEWYLLPDAERRALLSEHGQLARDYPDVRANTVASFALGDYEWILAFESAELHRIVDLMRHLRSSETRRHVREEVPFYTGRRRSVAELVAALP